MFEVIVAGALVAGGAAILSRHQPGTSRAPTSAGIVSMLDAASADLPCPWCMAATVESDSHCPSCRQPFG